MNDMKSSSKTHYEVVIEFNTPMTAKYKVWAYSEEEAAKIVEDCRISPYYISKPKIVKNSIKSLAVYLSGTINKLLGYTR
jgi:hypothetical protein